MPIISVHRDIAFMGMFPDKITTDYMNVGDSGAHIRVGTRMVAIRGDEDKYCLQIDVKTSASFLDNLKKAPVASILSLGAHFTRSQRQYDVSIQDAVDTLRAFEMQHAGNGRPFPRADDGRHFSKVPKLVRVGLRDDEPSEPVMP